MSHTARLLVLVLVMATLSCGGGPSNGVGTDAPAGNGADSDTAGAGTSAAGVLAGLAATDRHAHLGSTRQGAHLNEIIVVGSHAYVTNATDLVTTYRLHDDGALEPVHDAAQEDEGWHCQTAAAHVASQTLFCREAEDALRDVLALDISDPAAPTPRPLTGKASGYSVRDLEVMGDGLFAAALRDGLRRAAIAADGTPGTFERVAPELTLVDKLATDGTHLAVWDRHAGVVLLDSDMVEVTRVEVEGPPTDLAFRDGRLVVGRGSLGAVLYSWTHGVLTEVATIEPACTVSAVDVAGDLLAVGCLSGIYAYDLTGGEPQLFGFEPSLGVMVDVAMHGTSVLASDWRWLHRYATNPDGDVVALDRPRGRHIRAGDPAELALRNVGGFTLSVRVWGIVDDERKKVDEFEVGPAATVPFTLTAETLAGLADGWGRVELVIDTVEGKSVLEEYDHLQTIFVVVASDAATVPPALGEPFPGIAVSELDDGVQLLPGSGAKRVVFFSLACAGMWDEVLDLAWQAEHDPAATPTVSIADDAPEWATAFQESWGLEALPLFTLGGSHASWAGAAERVGPALYEEGFQLLDIPGGASHPTDYVLDASGVVTHIERNYRGPYPL